MKISVAIAAYRGGKFIGGQLQSIAVQSRVPDEVIVCDDCPDEGTRLAVEKFSGVLPLRYRVNERQLGAAGNFNAALSACSGDVVFLCDQDDLWYPEKVAIMSRMLDPGTVGGVFCDSDICDENGRKSGFTHFDSRGYSSLKKSVAGVWQGQLYASCRRFPGAGHDMAVTGKFLQKLLPLPDLPDCHDNFLGVAGAAMGAWQVMPRAMGIFRRHADAHSGAGARKSLLRAWAQARESVKNNSFAWNAALFAEVLARLPDLPEDVQEILRARRDHSAVRAAMTDMSRGGRLGAIWREMRSGNYAKFGRGWKNVVQDMFFR